MINFMDLKSQYLSIKNEIDTAIFDVINESAFIGGEKVSSFEKEFSDAIESKFCICVGNGTDAIEIALEAASLPKNSEVLVPANSFIASSEAVTRTGHKVKFVDIDPDNYTICPESIRRSITPQTKAIIAVHLYGHPCDMDSIMAIAHEFSLIVIEDCAQAHLAEFNGKKVGTIGHFGTFSFYPGKNLGAYGDGGAIVTQNENYAILARKIANHGRIGKYDHDLEGRNSRLDGMQASILSVKLKHLDAWTNTRIKLAEKYTELLADLVDITLPKRESFAKQVYHLFVIRCEEPMKLKEFLASKNIQTGVHYPVALPKLKAYDYLGQVDNAPIACSYDSQLLSLPIGEHLSNVDIVYITNAIKEYYGKG